MVGDAQRDITAGKGAGVVTIHVNNMWTQAPAHQPDDHGDAFSAHWIE